MNEAEIIRKKKLLKGTINFFKEFDFEPSIRFVDTLSKQVQTKGMNGGINYINRYFELIDTPYLNAIRQKLQSEECKDMLMCYALPEMHTNKNVNNRLDIYYGPAGTGKTTQAAFESSGRVVPCHSGMMPEDLLEVFDFNDVNGNPVYKPSALQIAMKEGKKVCLDEINLLPFETVRFLQTLTDGKSSIIFKDQVIQIRSGFKIIGTMNLKVGNQIFPLPAPLVDRAENIVKYSITPDMLFDMIWA